MAGNTFVAGETLTYVTDQKRQPIFLLLAGFRPNSEIIGKFRKLKKFYGHFVKRQK